MLWTIHAAAKEWMTADATIVKGLKYNDLYRTDGENYTTHEIDIALNGDLKRERTRHERAQADIAELEAKQKQGETVDMAEAAAWVRATLNPVREQVLAMPGKLAEAVNPSDPVHARELLDDWAKRFLEHCRANLP
jgi:phage terminase Nu1 subunit (DNA packaging protein)